MDDDAAKDAVSQTNNMWVWWTREDRICNRSKCVGRKYT